MPWSPEPSTDHALVPFYDGILHMAPDDLLGSWAGRPALDEPRAGRVDGVDAFVRWATQTRRWLLDADARPAHRIRASGLAFTFLRDSLYLELVPRLASDEGVIAGPAGDGRIAWVARDEVAEAAVAVLTGGGHDGQTYGMTGPEARTLADAAEQLTKFSGRRVVYRNESLEEAYASRSAYGAPGWEVDGWVTSYACIATGEMDVVSDAIPRLTGHPAQSLPEYLAAHPESYAHLRRD
jgi:uncharacterized protein YbjT (DUF2867 family)